MAITDFLFKSEKDIEAPKMQREELERIHQMMGRIGGTESGFSGISDVGGLEKRFGVSPFSREKYTRSLKDIYGSQRRNLATSLAKSRSSLKRRMSASEATPEALFQPLESQYAGAYGDIATGEAGAMTESFDKEQKYTMDIAGFLSNVIGQSDAFTKWKQGALMQGEGMRAGQVGNVVGSMNDDTLLSDIVSLADAYKKIFPGNPSTPTV